MTTIQMYLVGWITKKYIYGSKSIYLVMQFIEQNMWMNREQEDKSS